MKKFKISKKAKNLSSFIAMDVLEEIKAMQARGEDVISLSIGEPDFPPPPAAKKALIQAVKDDFTQYTHSQGLPELRQAIVDHYQKRYQVKISPEQIIVTSGTSPALLLTFGALLNAQDEVILTDPHYPCYSNFIQFLDGKIRYVKVREEDAFQYRPEVVKKKINSKTKAIFVNSPANPTGCVIPKSTLQALAKLGPTLVSDEIYHGLTYEGDEHSILEFTDNAFVLNGFSKAYAMTGFRLGYLIAPLAYIPALQKMQQNFFISTSSFVQRAGLAALKNANRDQAKMRKIFNERRKVMLEGVRKLGFKVAVEPTGAFYIFANAKHFTHNSYQFVFELLKEAKVGLTPGVDFGPGGEGFVRFSYAAEMDRIQEALKRIQKFLKRKGY